MERLQTNRQNKQLHNKRILKLLICFIGLVCFSGISQNNEIRVDEFYKTVDSILICKKTYNFNDTILFIQKSLESYMNNQVSANFDSFFNVINQNIKTS